MILDERAMAWTVEVSELAAQHGWTAYAQQLRNQRQHMPSVVLVRGPQVLLVYLRTSKRADRLPPLQAMTELTGVSAVLWTPADKALIRAALL